MGLEPKNYGLLIDNFIKDRKINDILTVASKYNFFWYGFNSDIINSEIVEEILANNLTITIYSEKNLKVNEANQLWSIGIKSIFTDDPTDFQII